MGGVRGLVAESKVQLGDLTAGSDVQGRGSSVQGLPSEGSHPSRSQIVVLAQMVGGFFSLSLACAASQLVQTPTEQSDE